MTDEVGAKYWRLPEEMRMRAQWCLAGPDKAPYLVGPNGRYHASPVEGPWLDFASAVHYATQCGWGIGYIITPSDPFTCIDMDVKDAESKDADGNPLPPILYTHKNSLDFYSGIVQFANSYTELSSSGKGLHVWVKGSIDRGRRGKGIEIYPHSRFIVCTGNPVSKVEYITINDVAIPLLKEVKELPIADGTLILRNLVQDLALTDVTIDLVELEASASDEDIWARARSAANSEKFVELCKGNWQQFKFPTQSEADLALMSMFTFYSKSNAQCRRLFRQTALGQRSKAVKNDVYLDRTLQLIRSRQDRADTAFKRGEEIAKNLLSNRPPIVNIEDLPAPDPKVQEYLKHQDQAKYSESEPAKIEYELPEVRGLEWPPGLVGALAGFIYNSSPRPVKEIAIVTSLALMAGITGKAYNVGQTGINLYIILIARSGVGKETIHSGIGHILDSQCGHVITPFVDYNEYVSGPALTKAMEGWGSFLNVSGEWGKRLKRMADDNRDGPLQQVRTVMTHLYQKSGRGSVVGGLGYSNKEKNISSTRAVAYSMIGETTPGTFYDSLTPAMMEDGFLSRFNIVEYLGDRVATNTNQQTQLPQELSQALASIASHCVSIMNAPSGVSIQVKMSPAAENMLKAFDKDCDIKCNEAGSEEAIRQIWSRAHLKAIRVSGVLAASDNHINPIITEEHATWALNLVLMDANSMLAKVEGGDIGGDDTSRFRKLQAILLDYIQGRVPKSYSLNPQLVADRVVPRKFLQGRTSQIRCYQNYRMGAVLALDHTLKAAIDSGYIMELPRDKTFEMYGYHGRAFRVLDMDI